MAISIKAAFRRLPVLIFALLLPLCACHNRRITVIEEKSPLGSVDLTDVTLGSSDTTSPATKMDHDVVIQEERLGWKGFVISESWKGVEINENCQSGDDNLPWIDFSSLSICELHNFELFFNRFSEDAAFQMSTTKFPLKLTTIIPPWEVTDPDQFGLLKEIECLNLPKSSSTRPLFPIKEEYERNQFIFTYTLEGLVATVKLQIEGTGYCVYYIFTWNRCWILSEIKDSST